MELSTVFQPVAAMSEEALQEGREGVSLSYSVKLYLVNIAFSPSAIWHSHSAQQTKGLESHTTFLALQMFNWPEPCQRTWAVLWPFQFIACIDPQTVATITPWLNIGINRTLVLIRFTTSSLVFVTLSCLITPVDPWSDGRVIGERRTLTYSWSLWCRC